MSKVSSHHLSELHRTDRIAWLRAAVLGANDGILSTAALVVGVSSAEFSSQTILLSGIAGLMAGAMSMAAGEYVSVSAQADIESTELKREHEEILANPRGEHEELAQIYVERGLSLDLARQVSEQLMKHDAIGAHARDELGITHVLKARPVQAALTSAVSFAIGATLPLILVLIVSREELSVSVFLSTLALLVGLGGWSARMAGVEMWRGIVRVVFWGALAMALTAGVGSYFKIGG